LVLQKLKAAEISEAEKAQQRERIKKLQESSSVSAILLLPHLPPRRF
jgi:hypothetical protein